MTGSDLREIFETILPTDAIDFFATQLGVVERERKLDIALFVRSSVLSAGTPFGGMQADAIRNYLEAGGSEMARSAFYRRYDEKFEALMKTLAELALDFARKEQVDLPGILSGVTDWRIVDSTTVKLTDAVSGELRGTGEYAAIKVHKTLSIGCGATVAYHFSEAREHDSRHLEIDESWRGFGLLCDLGYASLKRLRACERHGVKYVMRLKENWKPRVNLIARGEVSGTFLQGTDLDALVEDDVLLLDGKAVDLDVTLGSGEEAVKARLVGVPLPKGGYGFWLTNLAPSIGPLQVADLYRIRWEVEMSFKLDKGAYRLDEPKGQRTCSIKALLHASLIASIITAVIAHRANLATRPARAGQARTKPPVHTGLLAKALVTGAQGIARCFELEGDAATREWERRAKALIAVSKDPNWRRSPSILDQLRGWPITPRKPGRKSARKPSRRASAA